MSAVRLRQTACLWLVASLSLWGCIDNPYVIGELRSDAAVDTDAAPDAAILDPCVDHSGALACSGFEYAGLSDWPAPIVVGSADVERSTARARSGSGALRAESRGPDSTAVVAQEFEPRFGGSLYLRAWLYLPGGVPTETMNLFFLGDEPNPTGEPPAPFLGMDLNLEDGAVQLYSPQNAPDRTTGSLQVPRDRWFCLHAEFEIGDRGAVRVFADDDLALEVSPQDTLPEAGVHLLRAGIDWSSGQTESFEVFMDDLVLSEERVACSAP